MSADQKKRGSSGFLLFVLLVMLLACASFGGYIWLISQDKEASAVGEFSEKPALAQDFAAAKYGLKDFQGIWGNGNSQLPVSYGDVRLVAGHLPSGSSVIMQLSEDGSSDWSVDLGAPLVACSRSTINQPNQPEKPAFLPCLIRSDQGDTVTLINLNDHSGKWIWSQPEKYLNIAVKGEHILLFNESMTLTTINQNGARIGEPLLSQKDSESKFLPNTEKCDLPKDGNQLMPERFEVINDGAYLLTHGGINYFIDPRANVIVGALPGEIQGSPQSQDTLSISPVDGCTPAYKVLPGRLWISALPEGVTVPRSLDGKLPSLVARDGQLQKINWESQRLSNPLFKEANLHLGNRTQILVGKEKVYLSSNNLLTRIDVRTGRKDWSLTDNISNFSLVNDVLIYQTFDGDVRAISANEGVELWSLPEKQAENLIVQQSHHNIILSGKKVLQTYVSIKEGQTVITAQPKPSTPQKATTGLTFAVDQCLVVMVNSQPNSETYPVTYVPVDCSDQKSRKIIRVVTSEELARGSSPEAIYQLCKTNGVGNTPPATPGTPAPATNPSVSQTRSALTVNSEIVDPHISGLCTN